jgi:hypothetical protein
MSLTTELVQDGVRKTVRFVEYVTIDAVADLAMKTAAATRFAGVPRPTELCSRAVRRQLLRIYPPRA